MFLLLSASTLYTFFFLLLLLLFFVLTIDRWTTLTICWLLRINNTVNEGAKHLPVFLPDRLNTIVIVEKREKEAVGRSQTTRKLHHRSRPIYLFGSLSLLCIQISYFQLSPVPLSPEIGSAAAAATAEAPFFFFLLLLLLLLPYKKKQERTGLYRSIHGSSIYIGTIYHRVRSASLHLSPSDDEPDSIICSPKQL